jgi:lipoprotein-releasing system permease protein
VTGRLGAWELLVGFRYLRARRKDAFVSLIALIAGAGVAIGVMTLCIVLAVMTGFEEDIRERILGFNPHIVVLSHGGVLRDGEEAARTVRDAPGVARAAPFVYGQAMLSGVDVVSGAVIRGVAPERIDDVVEVRRHMKRGSADGLGEPLEVEALIDGEIERVQASQILLGFELAKTLGVGVGDWVNLMSPMGSPSAVGMVPRVKRFAVGGIFDSGMYDYDSTIVYMSLEDAQTFFKMGDVVSGLEVRVDELDDAPLVAAAIEERLGYPFYARDWTEVNRNLFVAFQLEKVIYFVVLMLIVLVAAFNIVASLIMVVMERRKDIAILKSMGATHRAVGRIFVFQGALIGVVGTIVGVLGGLVGSLLLRRYQFIELPENVFYVNTVPVRLEPENFLVVAAVSILICVLATLYPARQAARLAPVEVIRYE